MRPDRRAAALDLLPVALFGVHAALFRTLLIDDAYILYRYAASWATGGGPFFNPGEAVEGYSSPLWVILAALLHRIAGHAALPLLMKGAGALAGAVTVLLAARLTRTLAARAGWERPAAAWAGLLAGCVLALSPAFAMHAMNGLETAPYAACLVLAALLHVRTGALPTRRWSAAAWALAAASLLRPEGVAIAALLCLIQALAIAPDRPAAASRWRPLADLGPVAAVLALVALHRWLVYEGAWLPNTYHAKIGGFWGIGRGPYVAAGLLPPLLGIPGIALALVGLLRAPRLARRAAPAVAAGLAGALLPLVLGSDWMPGARLLVPYLSLLVVGAALGWLSCARWATAPLRSRGLARSVAAALALTALATAATAGFSQRADRASWRHYAAVRARGYSAGHDALAHWLGEHTTPGDTIALMDVGLVGYRRMDLNIVDLAGLTDRGIGRSPGGSLGKRYDPAYVLDRDPTHLILVFTAPRPRPDFAVRRAELAPALADLEPLLPHARTIYQHPGFRARYLAPPAASPPSAERSIEALAAGLGAARIFVHDHPWRHYLLAVFERQSKGQER